MSESFELAHPWVLLALLLLPAWAFFRVRRRRRDAVPYAPLQTASRGRKGWAWLSLPVELAMLAAVVVGLAGPYRSTELELFEDEGIDVVLVLDVSLSMLATDIPPNRLEALRRVARGFIQRGGGHRLGIVIFAGDAFVQTPLTGDHPVLLELLDGVSVYAVDQAKSGGTAIGDALLVAAERLLASRVEGRDQAVVVITDGASNLGLDPVLAARYLRQNEIRLHAIGIGGEEPVEVSFEGERVGGDRPYLAALDESQLRAAATAAEGSFYRARDGDALVEIFARLSRLESAPLEVRIHRTRRFFTASLAFLALPLFVLHLLLRNGARRPLR